MAAATRRATLVLLLLATALAAPAPGAWVHPGVLVSQRQLAHIRASVRAGLQPFAGMWTKLQASWHGSLTAMPLGPPVSGTIECGSYSVPDYGCSAESKDGTVAYVQAVMWAVSDDARYAANAMRIMDLYAATVTKYNNSNAALQTAWSALKFARAAEIIRHTGAGWPAESIANFTRFLTKVQLPLIVNGWGGGWQLVCACVVLWRGGISACCQPSLPCPTAPLTPSLSSFVGSSP